MGKRNKSISVDQSIPRERLQVLCFQDEFEGVFQLKANGNKLADWAEKRYESLFEFWLEKEPQLLGRVEKSEFVRAMSARARSLMEKRLPLLIEVLYQTLITELVLHDWPFFLDSLKTPRERIKSSLPSKSELTEKQSRLYATSLKTSWLSAPGARKELSDLELMIAISEAMSSTRAELRTYSCIADKVRKRYKLDLGFTGNALRMRLQRMGVNWKELKKRTEFVGKTVH